MENPLFGSALFSPSPVQGTTNNPVWNTSVAEGAAPNPSSAVRGMRRLGELQPWELGNNELAAGAGTPQVPAAAAAAAVGRDRPEESEFAAVLGRSLRGELEPAEAITAYADVCRVRAAELRDLAASQLQRAPRYMALGEAAAELEAEAATWQLLWFLHGVPGRDFPAGRGGNFVEGAGFAKTFHQLAADLLFQEEGLNRAGRTVAWLESLAASADPEPEQGLARKDGVWQETRSKLSTGSGASAALSGRSSGLVTSLDPDATTRQRSKLDADNTKDEERLMKMVWRLTRSGRLARAAAACEYAGQPWRAASLGACGLHGPLPLGAAAEDADEADGALQADALAGEVEMGPTATRALWRWACYQAAERIASTSEATGQGKHEAAVYGVLSGHVTRALPACATWEDALWAHLRCWLECTVDAEVGAQLPGPVDNAALAGMPVDAIAPGSDPSDAGTVAEGMAVAAGGWPVSRVRDALPKTFEEAVESGGSHFGGAAASASSGAMRFRRVQLDLILDRVDRLVSGGLVRWIIGEGVAAHGTDSDTGPACPPGLMRFAAHLSLMLWSLGIASVPEDGAPSAAYSQLHDLLQRLVQVYTVHLIDSGAHALVPAYACHLRAGLRRATYLLLMEQLLAGGDAGACREAYTSASRWFSTWGHGDVEEDEMAIIAKKAVNKAQMESIGGPVQRSRTLAWLCFDPSTHADAVRWACSLCREFALGGIGGVAGAVALLADVIPSALGGEAALDALLHSAETSGAAAEAAELRAWAHFFELESEYASWEEIYVASIDDVAAAGEDPTAGALADLANETLPLLQAAVTFLKQGPCPWLVVDNQLEGASGGPLPAPAGEVAVVVGPEAAPEETLPEIAAGEAYPCYSPEDQQALSQALISALNAAIASSEDNSQLTVDAGAAPTDGSVHLPGLVSVAVDCGEDQTAQTAAGELIAALLKGTLTGPDGAPLGPFVVTNMSAAPSVSADLSRAVCYPRVALKAAALRHAVAYMGYNGSEGSEVVDLINGEGVAGLFTQEEAAAVREQEKAAAGLQRRRAQAEGRTHGE